MVMAKIVSTVERLTAVEVPSNDLHKGLANSRRKSPFALGRNTHGANYLCTLFAHDCSGLSSFLGPVTLLWVPTQGRVFGYVRGTAHPQLRLERQLVLGPHEGLL